MKPTLQLFIYILFVLLCYFFSSTRIDFSRKKIIFIKSNVYNKDFPRQFNEPFLINIVKIFLLSMIFGIYSIYVSKENLTSDRYNYAIRFANQLEGQWTPGLNFLAKMLQSISSDPNILFFAISFIHVLITLVAFNKSEITTVKALMLLLVSNYFIFSFNWLKQAPAIAFSSLAYVAFTKRKKGLSLLFVIISILFHESAVILLPVFILLLNFNKKSVRILASMGILLLFLFYPIVNEYLVKIAINIFPFLESQLQIYLNPSYEFKSAYTENFLTILKGIPYYLITLYAIINRRTLKRKINNYDSYVFLSSIVSISIALSYYMYWMFRFATYFYFPTIVFAGMMIKEMRNNRSNLFFEVITTVSLTFLTIRYLYQMFFIHGGF